LLPLIGVYRRSSAVPASRAQRLSEHILKGQALSARSIESAALLDLAHESRITQHINCAAPQSGPASSGALLAARG